MNTTNSPFIQIRQQLFEYYGWEFDSLTDRMLDVALEKIAQEKKLTKMRIVERLPSDAMLREKLLNRLVIPETSFFRYPESFSYLKDIALKWSKKNTGKKLRIASIPCATGEEPYSIAMSLLDAGINQFEIDALDISLPLIEQARLGIYSHNKLNQYAQVSEKIYFDKHPIGLQIKPILREQINFIQGNITELPVAFLEKKYDIIFCRNLLIYLSPKHRNDLAAKIKQILHPQGTLFVGPVEVSFFSQQGLISLKKPKTYTLALSSERQSSTPKKIKPTMAKPNKAPFMHLKRDIDNNKSVPKLVSTPRKQKITNKPAVSQETPDPLTSARQLANMGEFKEALALTEKIIAKSKAVEVYLLHGEILLALKQFPNAIYTFKKVLYLHSQNKQALQHLALLSQRLGDDENAHRYLKRLNGLQEL